MKRLLIITGLAMALFLPSMFVIDTLGVSEAVADSPVASFVVDALFVSDAMGVEIQPANEGGGSTCQPYPVYSCWYYGGEVIHYICNTWWVYPCG